MNYNPFYSDLGHTSVIDIRRDALKKLNEGYKRDLEETVLACLAAGVPANRIEVYNQEVETAPDGFIMRCLIGFK